MRLRGGLKPACGVLDVSQMYPPSSVERIHVIKAVQALVSTDPLGST